MGNDTSIELVVTPVPPSVSANWEDEQDKLLPDGNTKEKSFQEGNADAMPDTNDKGFQPILPTTRTGRVHTRPTKLQDFETQYHAASIDGVVSSIQTNFYSTLCDLEEEEFEMHQIAVVGAGIDGDFDDTSKLQVITTSRHCKMLMQKDGNAKSIMNMTE